MGAVFWGEEATVSRNVRTPLAAGETVKVLITRREPLPAVQPVE